VVPTVPVFVDANALVPTSLADVLLRLAEKRVLELFWADLVLDDAQRVIDRPTSASAG